MVEYPSGFGLVCFLMGIKFSKCIYFMYNIVFMLCIMDKIRQSVYRKYPKPEHEFHAGFKIQANLDPNPSERKLTFTFGWVDPCRFDLA